ncbi:hypothetical protein F183_A12090 [Bryobacterales bacterium F-183]|nr:hypothetical protein F183_A12090 [Bryobacterales bacterium F-183]
MSNMIAGRLLVSTLSTFVNRFSELLASLSVQSEHPPPRASSEDPMDLNVPYGAASAWADSPTGS